MSVAKLSAERCKACRRQFGFAADFCAYCGVAQRGDGVGPGTPFREAPASEFFGRVPASTVPTVSEPQAGIAAKQSASHTGVGTETNSVQQARADLSGPDGQQPFPGNNAEERTGLSAVGRASLAMAAAGVALLAVGVAAWMLRPAPPRSPAQSPRVVRLEAHGQSRALSFVEGERISWTYPVCAAPAPATCVELIAAGQARFTMGGSQEISQGRVTGHYTFHRAMAGQLRSSADTTVNIDVTRDAP